jgi:hypothetical protein
MGQTVQGLNLIRSRRHFLLPNARIAMEPNQPPLQKVLCFFLVVKQLARDVDPKTSSSTEVKNEGNLLPLPAVSLRDMSRDSLLFNLTV